MILHINPCVDVVFKAILGSEHHTRLLIHFINAILSLEGDHRVTRVTLRNPFNGKDKLNSKGCVVDVKAYDQLNRDFQIEIQVGVHGALLERMLYNWACIYQDKIKQGEDYSKLEPVYAIWLLAENLPALPTHVPGFPRMGKSAGLNQEERQRCDDLHVPFGIYSPTAGLYLSQHLAIHVVQLKKLATDVKIEDDRARWIYFFLNGENLDPDNLPKFMDTVEMREAMSIAETFAETRENHHLYLSRLDEYRTKLTIRNEYEQIKAELERERAEKERLLALLREADIPVNKSSQ